MNTSLDEFDDSVEAQLARLQPRLAVAAVMLVVGIGMNVATINERPALPTGGQLAARPTTESIAGLAVTMAEVTDIKTASIIARHLAALNGFPLGSHQADAIDHEIDRRLSPGVSNGKDG